MQVKFSLDSSSPIVAEATISISKPVQYVFNQIGEQFFHNYPKWAVEVVHFEPLDSHKVCVGAKAKQTRKDNGAKIESVFEITHYDPPAKLAFQGINAPYRHHYLLENAGGALTQLTFRFELLELDIFMRPFQKLIRTAIEDGAENTVENIKNLIES